jgi:hypothetical protein
MNGFMGVPPAYTFELARTLGVLQQLQVLLGGYATATLEDISSAIAGIQAEFGAQADLEGVIQQLVTRHLAEQYARRKAAREVAA